jgi:hypothetical protein
MIVVSCESVSWQINWLPNNSLERTPRAGRLIDGSGQAVGWLWV